MGDRRCFVIHGGMVGVADDGDGRNRIRSICRELRWHKLLAGLELDVAHRGSRSRPCEWPLIGLHDSCSHWFKEERTVFAFFVQVTSRKSTVRIAQNSIRNQDACLNISCWLRFHCSLHCSSHPEESLPPRMNAMYWASLSHIHRID